MSSHAQPTLGSLFAGIGGFDCGFEQAGFRTVWQVEINPFARAILADRFPAARQHADVRDVGGEKLARVDCITAGFPCTNISAMGNSRRGGQPGLDGEASGLFFEVVRIARELQPSWLVLENVPALLSSNGGRDFERVLRSLAECGYVGAWRVLDARYFGVPQARRRVYLVAGLGRHPTPDFLADAAPVEPIPISLGQERLPRPSDAFASHTLTAQNSAARINMGSEVLVAEEDGWGAMVERERSARLHGLPSGLDAANWAARHGAGNAVCPPVAEWIARKILVS